ncbi:sialate O-acetylesterase [Coraliomargarita sinensis]|uniref:Sialate O-acetylesterase n=2 Tax=Coraliomargarita sinensis TaxID=2174842 RepID=A0A317ZE99_9BACT|nr:sialate O-acetylesterase [Coraliomargarita sinensis]
MPVPIWGRAAPGSPISVEFGDQKMQTRADASGEWRVHLEPIPATSDPRDMILRNGNEPEIRFRNIVVGEVWICSGQSNMQMRVKFAPEVDALRPSVENVRSFEVKNTVAVAEKNDCRGKWVTQAPDSAVALAFAYCLEEAIDVPIGIILTSWGSSSIEAWMPRDMTDTVPHFKTIMEEFDADTGTLERIQSILDGPRPWPKRDDIFLRRQPNILYNAMMHPLVPYACRGLVWYQGERNTQSMQGMLDEPWYARNSGMLKYGPTLKAWIRRYRQEWGRADLHFMVVMLPGYFKPLESGPQLGAEHPATHSWAWMREAQLKALELPHTSVVNTIDLGDLRNIHPKDKLPVGRRLALLARRDTLDEAVEAEGPEMQAVEVKEDRLLVHFDHAKGLTTTDAGPPTGFWIADESRVWVPAEAELDGETVVLHSDEIQIPRYVRYAFAGKPEVNLVNGAGLPAYPFRTDDFKP